MPVFYFYFPKKNGAPVDNLEPYLGAAMHLAIVRADFGDFIHRHGEVHAPGSAPQPQTPVGTHVHSSYLPPAFGPNVEAHMTFPEPGIYEIFGEFKHEGKVMVSRFFVQVN